MQNIATSNLSIININNKTSNSQLVRISGFPSTKSGFLCAFGGLEPPFSGISSTKSRFLCAFWVWNPCFRAFRAQNWHFCARDAGKAALGSLKISVYT